MRHWSLLYNDPSGEPLYWAGGSGCGHEHNLYGRCGDTHPGAGDPESAARGPHVREHGAEGCSRPVGHAAPAHGACWLGELITLSDEWQ